MTLATQSTVKKIILIASDLFARKGYRATRLDDIAQEMGMTKPALYYYFKNKHQILLSIFNEIMNIYTGSAMNIMIKEDLDPTTKFRFLIEKHAEAILNNQAYTTIFFHEQSELNEDERIEFRGRVRHYEKAFETVYRDGVNKGVFKDLNPKIVIKAIFGTINGLYTLSETLNHSAREEIIITYLKILEEGYKN